MLFIVFKVLDTEFFRGDPDQGGSASPVRNEKTALAHAHCSEAVSELVARDGGEAGILPGYTAWDIGFDRYLVKAVVQTPGNAGKPRTFLCKVVEQADPPPPRWVVQSIDFLE